MIGSLTLLAGWTLIGRRLLRSIVSDLPIEIELVIGFLLGNLVIVYTLFGLGWWLPQSALTYLLTVLAVVGGVWFWPKAVKWDKFWLAVVLFSALIFTGLYAFIWQQNSKEISLRMRGVWGDWGHHIGLPLYYKDLNRSTWDSPFTAGAKFTYSFLNVYIPIAMLHLGTSLRTSLLLPGVAWSVSLAMLVIYLGRLWGLGSLATWVPLALLINGNLGFVRFIQDLAKTKERWGVFLQNLPQEYGHIDQLGFHLGNFLDFFFVSQRAYLIGFGLGLVILIGLQKISQRRGFVLLGVVMGLLPLVHMHTFVSLSVILGVWTLSQWRKLKHWWWFWLPAAALAAPYFYWLYFANTALASGSFLAFKLGWMAQENWWWFWLKNAPIIAAAIIGFRLVPARLRGLVVGSWLLFGLVNLVQFQPNLADNNKLLVWWYLLAGVYPTLLLLQKLNRKLVTAFVLVVITLSGWLQLLWISQNTWQFADKEDLRLAEFAARSCVDRRWLTKDQHNHPVFTFAGRPLVLGYRGWLWTWGVNYSQVETDVQLMYTHPDETADLFSKYNISYAVIGPAETAEYHPDVLSWQKQYPLVYHTIKYLVFEVQPCLAK